MEFILLQPIKYTVGKKKVALDITCYDGQKEKNSFSSTFTKKGEDDKKA